MWAGVQRRVRVASRQMKPCIAFVSQSAERNTSAKDCCLGVQSDVHASPFDASRVKPRETDSGKPWGCHKHLDRARCDPDQRCDQDRMANGRSLRGLSGDTLVAEHIRTLT